MRVSLTYGHTLVRHPEYVPSCDGWKPGAEQELLSLEVDAPDDTPAWRFGEAVFAATNAPVDFWGPLEHAVEAGLARHRALGTRTWVMSTGDTVVVALPGARPVLMECASIGWTEHDITALVGA